MGSECNSNKKHYDISMSKRTRKPLKLEESNTSFADSGILADTLLNGLVEDDDQKGVPHVAHEEDKDPSCLKQLMNGKEKEKEKSGEGSKGRNSLGQHFTEEKQLPLAVRKQPHEGSQGAKLKSMVSRYTKVFGHLIKMKRDPRLGSRKKPVLRLTI